MGKASRSNRKCHGGAAYAKLVSMLPPFLVLPYLVDGPDGPAAPKGQRQMADFVYRNFCYYKRDKNNAARYHLLRAYFGYVVTEIWNEEDTRALRKVGNNRDGDEPPHCQVEALFVLSWVKFKRGYDMEGSADCLEKIIEICQNATPGERNQSLVVWLQNPYRSVDVFLRDREQKAKEQLHELYHQRMITLVTPDMEEVKVPSAAGNCCDHCQTTKQEIGTKVLLCCSRCKFEYYCSKDCQMEAWKTKHKKYCRAPGDFRPGDQALDGRNDTNVLLIHPTTPTSEAWLVSNIRKENKRTVPTMALRRLRPKLWQNVMTRKEAEENLKVIKQRMKAAKERLAEIKGELEEREGAGPGKGE